MKYFFTLFFFFVVSSILSSYKKHESLSAFNNDHGKKLKLYWSDEFNVSGRPDSSKWSYEIGNGPDGWGNQELEYYTNESKNAFVKNGMLDVLQQDFITTARAKGLNEHAVVYTHALRNALLPLITIIGLSIPGLIGGSVIAETIFAIPGMGKLFYDAVLMRDFPVIMGILTIGSALTLMGNLVADIAYAWADPRVRRGVMKG